MLTRNLTFRIAGPTLLVSLLFLGSCITAAFYLHHRQSALLRALDEDLWSRRLAADLLRALEALPGDRPAAEDALHGRIGVLIGQAERFADKPEEARLVGRLKDGFDRYLRGRRTGAAPAAASEDGGREAPAILEAELVPTCRELERFNSAEVDRSEGALQRAVTSMAWGLAGVGAIGSLAGLLMGYGVARGLGRSVLRAEELAEVGQLAAGVAHELRNPLTAIKMLVQTNREEAEARGLPAEDLNVIEQEIRRMEGRLQRFLDFARPPKPERRRVDLAAVVDRDARPGRRPGPQAAGDAGVRPARDPGRGRGRRRAGPAVAGQPGPECPGRHAAGRHPGDRAPSRRATVTPSWRCATPGRASPPRHLSAALRAVLQQQGDGARAGPGRLPADRRDHGGSLRATNRPQGGACFVLRLPATRGPG